MTLPSTGGVLDWSGAVRAGQALVPTGPRVTPAEAAAAVDDLRRFSARAELVVRDVTGLGAGLPVGEAQVVDRRRWVAATAEGMAELTAPLDRALQQRAGITRTVGGAQVGAVLGFLSGKVLGQFDPVVDGGRLLLVAPNIIQVERELGVDPADFRMWVCLHESTHRLQFHAVPWLRDHFVGLVGRYAEVADTDARDLLRRLRTALPGRDRADDAPDAPPGGHDGWIDRVQTPAQREVFDAITALMSLLEGHADHVMDAVGATVVPSVPQIRAAFTRRRRRGSGPLDRLLRSLLGMDAKLAQYVRGEKFVSAVVRAHGMTAFNRVWESPQTLPDRAELADPAAWAARVLR